MYQADDGSYTVLRVDTGDDTPITAVGAMPHVAPGEKLDMTGGWTTHPAYGQQFKVRFATRTLPTTAEGIYEYLASRSIRGIGRRTARLIVDEFGDDTLTVIAEEPERLSAIKGITLQKAREINRAFLRQATLRLLVEFLTRHELAPTLGLKLYQAYGDEALPALKDNPYIAADPAFGGQFRAADALAQNLGILPTDAARLEAGTIFTLEHNAGNGHSFIPRDKLIAATARLLGVDAPLCATALDNLIEDGRVAADTLRGIAVCYLDYMYEAECAVTARIAHLAAGVPGGKADVAALIAEIERESGITYAAEQRRAVQMAGTSAALVITGLPGTGKTTTVRGILHLFDRMGLRIALAAPTGRAAKRLQELTDREAVTIHRLLEAGFAPGGDKLQFGRDAENPLDADAVILDEASMVDLLLADAALAALPPDCRLVLVGDADQLPSVGPGNFFSDIIRAETMPVVRLTEIFRQAKESGIIRNAHAINRGETPDLPREEKDFFFIQRLDPARTVDTVVDLVARRLPEGMQIPAMDIQVLTPTRRGEAGTRNLNARLQTALNPPAPDKAEKQAAVGILRVGDKVMQIRNNYDILWNEPGGGRGMGVFNGDIGQILDIDRREDTVTVDFEGRQVVYTADAIGDLEPAWAMTVHKSQGSEYRAVVFVLERAAPMLLTRKVLYTGATRARELLVFVGDAGVMQTMVAQNHLQKRYSGLKLRLTEG